jgi:hypothetical protein
MSHSSGAVAHPHPFDHEAFEELAAFVAEAKRAFDLNAIDRGFERIIERPIRATTGKLLAHRLVRDGRKYLKDHRRREILSDKIEAVSNGDSPTDVDLDDIRWAVTVIRNGLMSLTPRERLALATKADDGVADNLAVKPRQFRNLVAIARVRLWQKSDIDLAYLVMMDAINLWRFETIELMFPLVGCMAVPA